MSFATVGAGGKGGGVNPRFETISRISFARRGPCLFIEPSHYFFLFHFIPRSDLGRDVVKPPNRV